MVISETTPVADTKADALRRAATLAYLAYYEPTGIIVHPSDWEDIELTKNSQGTYLLAMSVAGGAESRVWHLVIDTPAIASGTALVGAFGTGAQLTTVRLLRSVFRSSTQTLRPQRHRGAC